jgi:PAS domain S-box-containing protein
MMPSNDTLESRIAELEKKQAIANRLLQIGQGLNRAEDEDDILHVLARPALEAGVFSAELDYVDCDEDGNPEWIETVAVWQAQNLEVVKKTLGRRGYLPDNPFFELWLKQTDGCLVVEDMQSDERLDEHLRAIAKQHSIKASVVIILKQAGNWIGVFTVTWAESHAFTDEETAIYRSLPAMAGPAIANRRAYLSEQQARREREMLYQISQKLNGAKSDAEVLDILAGPAIEAGAFFADLIYAEGETGDLEWGEVVASWDKMGGDLVPVGTRYYFPEFPLSGLLVQDMESPTVIPNVPESELVDENTRGLLVDALHTRALVTIPLSQSGRWIGFLVFLWDEVHELSESERTYYETLPVLASAAVANRRQIRLTQRSEALIRAAVDATPDWMFAKDREFRWILANKAIAEAVGTTPDQLVGKTDLELGWTEDEVFGNEEKGIVGFRADDEAVLAGEEIHNPNDPATLTDGETHIFDTYKVPLRDTDGNIFGVLGFSRDVTEMIQAQDALQEAYDRAERLVEERSSELEESRGLLRAFLDNFPALVFAKNTKGEIILGNDALAAFFGVESLNEVLGKTVHDFLPDEMADPIWESEKSVLETGEVLEIEEIALRDGEERNMLTTKFPLYNAEREIYAVGGLILDVTEQKQAEMERERLQQEVIRAQEIALKELSSPVIPVMPGVLVLPLIGTVDTARAQDIMETLLDTIVESGARVVIIDITGVPVVDTSIANYLLQMFRAVSLLGAECALVGISPEIAQTVVALGVELKGVTTRGNLSSGIEYALRRLGKKIVNL